MKIKCVLIDDEPLAIKVLQNYFVNFTDFEVVATFNNSLEALDFLNSTPVDAVFLQTADIQQETLRQRQYSAPFARVSLVIDSIEIAIFEFLTVAFDSNDWHDLKADPDFYSTPPALNHIPNQCLTTFARH